MRQYSWLDSTKQCGLADTSRVQYLVNASDSRGTVPRQIPLGFQLDNLVLEYDSNGLMPIPFRRLWHYESNNPTVIMPADVALATLPIFIKQAQQHAEKNDTLLSAQGWRTLIKRAQAQYAGTLAALGLAAAYLTSPGPDGWGLPRFLAR